MKFHSVFLLATVLTAAQLSASVITYTTFLTGPQEAPPNTSAGVGTGLVTIDTGLHTLLVSATFSGLTGTTTNSHIHCCTAAPGTGTAGVATQTPTFVGFPSGVTSGSYTSPLFDLTLASSWNPAFITAQGSIPNAEAALIAGLASGSAYLNIHSSAFGGGEIRGFLVPIPEPATLGLVGAVLAGLLAVRRKRWQS